MISYYGIIEYFKSFADKHTQINSFKQGSVENIDDAKMNEYPVLHIDITGTNIQDKVLVYDVDIYIITAVVSDDESQRVQSLSDTLWIMQDLHKEFSDGEYIVSKAIKLFGNDSLTCTPIQEDFKNRVYGWSTTMNLTAVNEFNKDSIPYPYTSSLIPSNSGKLLDDWFGGSVDLPITLNNLTFNDNMIWWSATARPSSNLYYIPAGNKLDYWRAWKVGATALTETLLLPDKDLDNQHAQQTVSIDYDRVEQALAFRGSEGGFYGMTTQFPSNVWVKQFFIIIKVKNISSKETDDIELLRLQSVAGAVTKGFALRVGSLTSDTEAHRGKVYVDDLTYTSSNEIVSHSIVDGSDDYIRETPITIGLIVNGNANTSTDEDKVTLYIDGERIGSPTIMTDVKASTDFIVGTNTGSYRAVFDLQELYTNFDTVNDNSLPAFEVYNKWLMNRDTNV